jgi:hypothetical protein
MRRCMGCRGECGMGGLRGVDAALLRFWVWFLWDGDLSWRLKANGTYL